MLPLYDYHISFYSTTHHDGKGVGRSNHYPRISSKQTSLRISESLVLKSVINMVVFANFIHLEVG
jgi:hypothetical protein